MHVVKRCLKQQGFEWHIRTRVSEHEKQGVGSRRRKLWSNLCLSRSHSWQQEIKSIKSWEISRMYTVHRIEQNLHELAVNFPRFDDWCLLSNWSQGSIHRLCSSAISTHVSGASGYKLGHWQTFHCGPWKHWKVRKRGAIHESCQLHHISPSSLGHVICHAPPGTVIWDVLIGTRGVACCPFHSTDVWWKRDSLNS